MGCTQSKIDGEGPVSRCRDRKLFMKDAVSSRNAFAAAHSSYTVSLRNTGAALSDFAPSHHVIPPSSSAAGPTSSDAPPSSDAPSSSSSAAAGPSVVPPADAALPPPPPPVPNFAPLQRAASMPEISLPKNGKHKQPLAPADSIEEGDADDEKDEDDDDDPHPPKRPYPPATAPAAAAEPASVWLGDYIFDTNGIPAPSLDHPDDPPQPPPRPVTPEPPPPPPPAADEAPPPPPPAKPAAKKQKAAAGPGEGKRGRAAASSGAGTGPKVNLPQVLEAIDDHFLKAWESAHLVSKMLEATRMHYHSNFADARGHIDHSARVLRVITWNRSIKGIPNEDDGKDDVDNDELETHATVLDKMLAWEKKLYDEVKAGELMKIEYQRKVSLLNKQKKRGASPGTLEKTKAAVSHMHTRLIVDMQSMDSTVSEINRLRDKHLYPKLVDLVGGMAKMWETMYAHHSAQRKIAADLRNIDVSAAPKETSEQHHERTIQLWKVVREWHSQFQKLMKHQKDYIQALNNWLKLNLIPIETSLRENPSSPPNVPRPEIQPLLHTWNDQLEKVPAELATTAIYGFSEVVHTIRIFQEDELKMKEKCEETRREYLRKKAAFEHWCQKYMEKQAAKAASASASAEAAADAEGGEAANQLDPIADRRAVVEGLKIKLAGEEEAYQRTCRQVREKSVGSLRTHLPELFRAMSEFSMACSEMYKKLFSIATTRSEDAAGPS